VLNSTTVVSQVAASILADPMGASVDATKAALRLPAHPRRPTDDELILIAFLASRTNPERIPLDDLKPYRQLLSTQTDIKRLCEQLSHLAKAETGKAENFYASKHVVSCSRLEANRDKVLKALDVIFHELESEGIKAALCYGTLLGAERNGSFIPHDDDVDLLYFDGSTSEVEARANIPKLIAEFEARGYPTYMCGFNFHVTIAGAEVDLFPSWAMDDKLFLMMERYKFRSISQSIMWPAGTVQLYDRTFPAPADRAAFLKERYGDGWRIPDPFYEWPWPLSAVDLSDETKEFDTVPRGFKEFLDEVTERSPAMEYVWTREKEISCGWIISQISSGKGVDVGGTEFLCKKLSEKGVDITCYDMFPPSEPIPHVKDDMINILDHFEEKSLDFITTRHTLEHSLVPLFQLWAYKRLLKEGGKLFVIVPIHHRDWVWFGTHHNCLPYDNWVMLFHRAGFKVEISDAGSWKPWDPKYIEYRFRLSVDSRALRL
jgi:hypothetical protein